MVIKGFISRMLNLFSESESECEEEHRHEKEHHEQEPENQELEIERRLWHVVRSIEEVQSQYHKLKEWVDLGLMPQTGQELLDQYMVVRKVDEPEYDELREEVRFENPQIPDEIFYEAFKCADRSIPASITDSTNKKSFRKELIDSYLASYIAHKEAENSGNLQLTEREKLQYAAEDRLWSTLELIQEPAVRFRAFREWYRLGLFPLTGESLTGQFVKDIR